MITPVQSPPIQTTNNASPLTAAAVGPAATSRPPISPGGAATGAAIEANLGGAVGGIGAIPPPPATPRSKAMEVINFTEKWAGELSRIADLSGVDIGNVLGFAHADVRRLAGDLQHNAPDSKIAQDTNRLLADWVTKGPHAFQALRHGLFRNTEQDVGQANAALSRAGVTSPEIHGALGELNNVLRMIDAFTNGGRPPGPIGGPIGGIGGGGIGGGGIGGIGGGIGGGLIGGPLGQLQFLVDQAMSKVSQAMAKDYQAHPEHRQALQGAMSTITGSLRQMMMGLQVTGSLQMAMMADLQRLGGFPRPQPGPFPFPQPLPQPQPPKAPSTGVVPLDAQAA